MQQKMCMTSYLHIAIKSCLQIYTFLLRSYTCAYIGRDSMSKVGGPVLRANLYDIIKTTAFAPASAILRFSLFD